MNRRMMKFFIGIIMGSNFLLAVDVTFQVDMQNEDTSNGVYLVGYWDWTFHEMSQVGGSATYAYPQSFSSSGSAYDYWFSSGNFDV